MLVQTKQRQRNEWHRVTHRRPVPVRRKRPNQPSVDNALRASWRPRNGVRFKDAIDRFHRRQVRGDYAEATAKTYEKLADAYVRLDMLAQALTLSEQAVKIWDRRQKNKEFIDPEDLIWSIRRLAFAYRELGSPEKALPLMERALTMAEEEYGSSNLATAAVMEELAQVYRH